jgi:beta-glucosidase
LSYTSFDYSNLFINREQVTCGESLDVSLTVMNTGSIAGEEVVQLYTRDEFSGTQRPLKALRGFAHVLLQPGESKTITFKLSADHFAFYDQELNLVLEPGRIHVLLGSSSTDIRLKSEFEIIGADTMPEEQRLFVCLVEVA